MHAGGRMRVRPPLLFPQKEQPVENIVDLTDLLPDQDIEYEIKLADGRPSGWKWTLASASHPQNVAFQEAETSAARERAKVITEAQFNGVRYEAAAKTTDQRLRENVQWIVARTLGWTPVRLKGQEYHFSREETENLLIKPEMSFAFEQLVSVLRTDARFMKRSA
jgi:hypothetical protein